MAFDIGLKTDGDLPSVWRYVSGSTLTLQRLRVALQLHLEEWLLDKSKGVPWYDWSQQKPPQVVAMAATLRAIAAETEGVTSIESFEGAFTQADRTVRFTGKAVIAGEADSVSITVTQSSGSNLAPRVFFNVGGRVC